MNFGKLRSRNGHKARGMVQAIEGEANVNRHQEGNLNEEIPRIGIVWGLRG